MIRYIYFYVICMLASYADELRRRSLGLSRNGGERLCDRPKECLLEMHTSICHRPGDGQGRIPSMSVKNQGISC